MPCGDLITGTEKRKDKMEDNACKGCQTPCMCTICAALISLAASMIEENNLKMLRGSNRVFPFGPLLKILATDTVVGASMDKNRMWNLPLANSQ